MRYPFNNFILKPYPEGSVMQGFGENPELYCNAIKYPDGSCLKAHNGGDYVAKYGTAIYPTTKQKVVEVKNDSGGYGKHVRTIGVEESLEHTYGHLSNVTCKIGQVLEETDQLGNMGNSGFVVSGATPYWEYNPFAGTHLHYGIREFRRYKGEKYWNIQYSTGDKALILNVDNGFRGAVDPMRQLLDSIDPKEEERKRIYEQIKLFSNLFGYNLMWLKKIAPLLKRLLWIR